MQVPTSTHRQPRRSSHRQKLLPCFVLHRKLPPKVPAGPLPSRRAGAARRSGRQKREQRQAQDSSGVAGGAPSSSSSVGEGRRRAAGEQRQQRPQHQQRSARAHRRASGAGAQALRARATRDVSRMGEWATGQQSPTLKKETLNNSEENPKQI